MSVLRETSGLPYNGRTSHLGAEMQRPTSPQLSIPFLSLLQEVVSSLGLYASPEVSFAYIHPVGRI
jgi:hypothetical protein